MASVGTHPFRTTPYVEPSRPVDPQIARLRTFAKVFDDYFLDPILGFVFPGVGDLVSSMLGLWIVSVAVRKQLAPVVIARMILNLAIDAVVGAIPILGDLADIAFKANDKNLTLLEARESTRKGTRADWIFVAGAILAFVAAIGLVLYVIGRVLKFLLNDL